MVALLGMLAAGAAMGARDASNNSVRALNELELSRARNGMEMDREALRMKYEEKRYQQQRDDSKEANKAKMVFDEAKYQRDRSDKLSDRETENKMKMQIEGMKESGRNARFGQRQSLLRENAKAGGGSAQGGIQLEDGSTFVPNDADSKNAVNLVKLKLADNLQDAYQKIYASKYASQAAGSVEGLTEGTVPTSMKMSGQLLNRQNNTVQNPQELIRSFNPKTGRFD